MLTTESVFTEWVRITLLGGDALRSACGSIGAKAESILKEKGKTEGAVVELCKHMVETARGVSAAQRDVIAERIARKNKMAIYDPKGNRWRIVKLIKEMAFGSAASDGYKEIGFLLVPEDKYYGWEVRPLVSVPIGSLSDDQYEKREIIYHGGES